MIRRGLVLPAIVVLAVSADIAVRLTDHPGPPGQAPPPAVADPGSPPPPPSPVPPVGDPGPGWSPSPFSPTPSATSPADPRRTPGPTGPDAIGPAAAGPGLAAQDPGPQVTSLDDLARRDDPLPAGIPEQLNYYSGGGRECEYLGITEPVGVAVAEGTTVPGVPVICVLPFPEPYQLDLITPTGTVRSVIRPAPADTYDAIPVPLPPGSASGRYRVRVTQGKGFVATEFVAQPARKPTMRVHPAHSFPGATVHAYLGGFPPGPADLHLYACREAPQGPEIPHYRTTHRVTVGADGAAHLALETNAFTSPTCYLLVSSLVFVPGSVGKDAVEAYGRFTLR